MTEIKKNFNLKHLNTFGVDCSCSFFTEITQINQLYDVLKTEQFIKNQVLIIGGGSNLLFTKNFEGLVLKNSLKGIQITEENTDTVKVKAMAGEVWQDFVMYCINKGWGGLENLSLIPGCVGASPMQNIGAYGVEIKDTFVELEAVDLKSGELKIFNKENCAFNYRESVFKKELKNKFIIVSVTFQLTKNAVVNTSYGAIQQELEKKGVKNPGIKDVSEAVIQIRQSKLPDPKVLGNAGSFFKNPEISMDKFQSLKNKFPDIVSYPLANGNIKLAAGWLIEQCGLKGFEMNGAGVHKQQALVLVNKDKANGQSIYDLSAYVMQKVFDKFEVALEREVNII
ncbi:MAG: UDP-N-acetylmuramate dehydrogenase [Sphingobacteriaceae bacterium]|nr:UDP-N-acetylmuramate dehydrogenase [Sphingobacteriaceae bacterium]